MLRLVISTKRQILFYLDITKASDKSNNVNANSPTAIGVV